MRGTAKGGGFRRLTLERLEPRLALDASMLRITEFLASNTDGLRDAEGDRPDWIEIFNSGNQAVDLSGMYLTDDDDNFREWQFPDDVSIPAGGYRLIFASNKDTVLAGGEIHTDFALSADGEFLALVDTDGTTIIDQYDPPPQLADISYGGAMQTAGSPTTVLASGAMGKAIVPTSDALGLTWTQAGFTGDAAWPYSGQTGFGYENNPGAPDSFSSLIKTTLPSGTGTAYIRVPFNLTSLVGIGKLTLRMKYDDGFVAYINGVRVAEANAPEVVQWNSQTGAARPDTQALIFSEFDVSGAIPHLRVGQNVLALHALNQGTGSDMLFVPELVAQPMMLITPEAIGHFYTPTPGYGNGSSVAGFTAEPVFDVPHGFYSAPQTVSISTPTPGAMIVYTTDGSTPQVDANLNVTNGVLYQNPLTISGTTTLRARAFRAAYEPSHAEASSYIFVDDVINQSPQGQAPGPGWPTGVVGQGQQMNYGIDPDIISQYGAQAVKNSLLSLSTFSITTDLPNLFDPSFGIYVNAQNRGNSWERPATVELIHPDGTPGFQVNAGLRIRGGFSRDGSNPKHAFRFFFRGDYGDAKLEYPLFGDEGVDEFDVLDLRTSQNYSWSYQGDNENTFEREVFGRDLQRDIGQPYTRSRYHHLYINGVYWGLFQSQERIEEFYAESYLGGQEEDYDVIVAGNGYTTEVESGNENAWRQLFDYAEALAAAPQANANLYWTMQGLNPDGTRNEALPVLLDVDNLIDYVLIIFYTGGFDSGLSRFIGDNAPNNWFTVYNRVAADRGFQHFIHDNEHSLGADGTSQINRTGPFNNGNQSSFLHSNPQFLHQDLMAHPEYKQRFIDHVQKYFFNGGAMTPAASIARLNERVAQSDPAIIAEAARWGDAKREPPFNKNHWQQQINFLRNSYFPSRGNLVLDQLRGDGLFTYSPITMAGFTAPTFSQHGGTVQRGYSLIITAGAGTIYYTTDGVTDPRAIGGQVNPSSAVMPYNVPISITGPTTVKARLRTTAGQWSGLVEATFDTLQMPGDYSNNGLVEETDYAVWRANYGNSVPSGTSADGNGDGVVNTADYVVWRKYFSSSTGAAQPALVPSETDSAAQTSSIVTTTDNGVSLVEPTKLIVSVESGNTRDNGRMTRHDEQFRPGVRGSIPQPVRDLLNMQVRPAFNRASDFPPESPRASAPEVDLAAGPKVTEDALDEMFSALGESRNYGLTALFSELSI
jgi:CotH kinase protein/Chitobiase/beta-hexosaminidase C-terminal domain/Lamin Tail Domain